MGIGLHNGRIGVANGRIGYVDDLAKGLMAYYPFNGNANDESGNGHNGTVNGATLTTDRHGNADSAYSFDGINDYIDLANNLNLSTKNWTFSIWTYITSISGTWHGIFSKGYWQAIGSYGFFIYNGVLYMKIGFNTGNVDISSSRTVQLNTWEHVVVTINRVGNISFYINGTLIRSLDISSHSSDDIINSISAKIGCGSFSSSFPTDKFTSGKIDDIRIYNRVLTIEEITQLYNE